MKINKSALITHADIKTGIGKYSLYLFKLGFFDDVVHFSYNGMSDWDKYVYFSNKWFINTRISYYIGSIYKRTIRKYNFVHLTAPALFHLTKYNKNATGTIHDFSALQYPQSTLLKIWFKKNLSYLEKLKGVVVISDHIKIQAEDFYPNLKFTRIHNWMDNPYFKIREKDQVKEKLGLEKNKIYLLSVGTDIPRKNIDLLPNIMNKLDDRFILIRIGDTNRILNKFKNKNQVITLLNLPEEIYALYFNASDLLIHTAIDGGFEYPYIEAIFSNLPIITFNMPISKEILHDKGIFINLDKGPTNPEEWVDAILKFYDKRVDYGNLIDYYGPNRAKKEYEAFYKNIGL